MLTQTPKIEIFHQDVTDNKTADNSPPIVYKDFSASFRCNMSDAMRFESERLKSFENRWPLSFINMHTLAQIGMYYTGSNDNVKCYFCGVEIGRWETSDHPVTEHMRWSSNCPLIRRRQTTNIPLDQAALDRVLPPQTYDVCGGTEILDIRPLAVAEDSLAQPTSSGGLFPDHPEYAIESARLRSFAEWPRTMKQKPGELAEAGFFYTGTGDRVKCFSCGGGLKDWDECDDPWEQHALWLGNCHFLKLVKGKQYIESVIEKFKTNESETKFETKTTEQQQAVEVQRIEPETINFKPTVKYQDTCGEEKKITDEKLCKICYVNEYNTAFLPCGHVVACVKCATSVTKCPMCRQPFTNVMRVYFS